MQRGGEQSSPIPSPFMIVGPFPCGESRKLAFLVDFRVGFGLSLGGMFFPSLDAKSLQIVGLHPSHFIPVLIRVVLVAENVQHSVDSVEEQFRLGRPTDVVGHPPRRVGGEDEFAIQKNIVIAEVEANDVGLVVVLQIAAIHFTDLGIGKDSHRHASLFHPGIGCHLLENLAEERNVHGFDFFGLMQEDLQWHNNIGGLGRSFWSARICGAGALERLEKHCDARYCPNDQNHRDARQNW